MNDISQTDPVFEGQKAWLWWLYLLHGASVIFSLGALSFIPLIINYLKRDETQGSLLGTHHSWQIRSFWWYLFWVALGWTMMLTIIGIPIALALFAGAWVWKVYRLIKGFLDLGNHKAMPMPTGSMPAEGQQ
jgi:uncharacterized membrane protein